ncbi:hypothetical protein AB4090_01220 [Acidithiobacillus sp. IBUN Pt1247-S3]|uniref:hypothetical protein n=1 Tax=Acidithiobacillus sp. IBUN Pt1247-S3 TaxID=3166642 RepID=UPI0034E47743
MLLPRYLAAVLLLFTPFAIAGATPVLQSDCQLAQIATAKQLPQRGMATWLAWQDDGSGMQLSSSDQLTAASSVLPSPSCARVENLTNHRSVVLLIDRKSPADSFGLLQLNTGAAQTLGITATTPVEVSDLAVATLNASAPDIAAQVVEEHFLWSSGYPSTRTAEAAWQDARRAGIAKLQIVPGLDQGNWAYRLRLGPLPSTLSPSILAQTLRHAGFSFHAIEND